ncbi:MAG: NepR family anti-sigma factor [Pseudomonadota bacterium]
MWARCQLGDARTSSGFEIVVVENATMNGGKTRSEAARANGAAVTAAGSEADDASTMDVTLADEVSAAVSERLKREYDTLLQSPVPDRFTDLLDQLSSIPSATADGDDTAEGTATAPHDHPDTKDA